MSAVANPPAPAPFPTRGAPPRPLRWTVEEYFKLGDLGFFAGRRVELIRGEIVEMGKQSWPHVLCIALVADVLRKVFAGAGWVAEHGPHPTSESAPEPDVRAIPGTPRDYADHPVTALLVVEVADTSLFYDTTTKAQLYAESGVTDYWVVDLENRQLHVFRDPQPIPEGGQAYRTHLTLGPTESVTPLAAPTAAVRVADLLP